MKSIIVIIMAYACSVTSVVSDFATLCTVAFQAPVYGDSPGKNIGVDCHFLFQGIFPTRDRTHISYALGSGLVTTNTTWEAQN